MSDTLQDFDSVKQRLEQIAAAVSDDSMPLDEALDLFEEAVSLSMQVSDLLEVGIDASALDGNSGEEDAGHQEGASDAGTASAEASEELGPVG